MSVPSPDIPTLLLTQETAEAIVAQLDGADLDGERAAAVEALVALTMQGADMVEIELDDARTLYAALEPQRSCFAEGTLHAYRELHGRLLLAE